MSNRDQLQLSIDSKIARDFGMNINDKITLNILGREVEGVIKSFRKVNYGDLSINFAILINPSFGRKIPHEYLSTVKFSKIDNFDESVFINKFPNISIIKISDYLKKLLNS